jgi:predicted GNAT superfamily acetyltransferase
MPETIAIRDLTTQDELHACVALQRETWGAGFSEVVPVAILQVVQYVGGVAAGAFNTRDELVGFVFGISGVEPSAHGVVPVHWSDMLAVRKAYRNQGIGERLKRYQRDLLLARGVEKVYWTFDPLDAKNAHVNFVRLGIIAREYRVDMYGETDSPLHQGIGTDRLIAVWPIATARVEQRLAKVRRLPTASSIVRIDVPTDIHEINAREPAVARAWRERTRAAFQEWLQKGYVVVDFVREATHGSYLLVAPSDFEM